LLACFIVGSITAINNYKKELQFRNLQQKQDDSHVTLWRNGEVLQAHINDVCVGDVVQLDTGAKIPAGISHYALLVLRVHFVITSVQTVS
jgi:Ca2+-transporting ATPase